MLAERLFPATTSEQRLWRARSARTASCWSILRIHSNQNYITMAAAIGFPVSAAFDILFIYVVPLWVNGASGLYPSAPLGVTFSGKLRRGVSWGAREPIQKNRVNFNLYVVSLWVNGAIGRVLGRLKRRPYEFCFYVVPLWVNGASNFCSFAPQGL